MYPHSSSSNYSFDPVDLVVSGFWLARNVDTGPAIPNGSTINTMSTQAGPLWLVVEVMNKAKIPGPINNVTVKVSGTHVKFKVGNAWVNNSISYTVNVPQSPRPVATRAFEIAPRIGPHGSVTMTLTATADAGQVVNEKNEQNNSLTIQFQVQDVS